MALTIKRTVHVDPLKMLAKAEDLTIEEASIKGAIYAAEGAPVDTGELQSSIDPIDGGWEAKAPHAAPVEYGTEHMRPQPFMRPALLRVQKEIGQIAQKAMRSAGG